MVKNLPANVEDIRGQGFHPWVGKTPWRRKWQPTPVFLQENPRDRGAWKATVPKVAKSQTQLKQLSMRAHVITLREGREGWGFEVTS